MIGWILFLVVLWLIWFWAVKRWIFPKHTTESDLLVQAFNRLSGHDPSIRRHSVGKRFSPDCGD